MYFYWGEYSWVYLDDVVLATFLSVEDLATDVRTPSGAFPDFLLGFAPTDTTAATDKFYFYFSSGGCGGGGGRRSSTSIDEEKRKNTPNKAEYARKRAR